MAADGKKLAHKELESFVADTLSKREPCPAMVLAWGWLLKQVRAAAPTSAPPHPAPRPQVAPTRTCV
jgi:hypothetical protein